MEKKTYSEKLKDPRWQKKRLEVFERDGWRCRKCGSDTNTLAVHHIKYHQGMEPWDYPSDELLTLCETCHNEEYEWRAHGEQVLVDELRIPGVFAVGVEALGLSISLSRRLSSKPADGLLDALIDAVYVYFEVREGLD